MSDSTIRRGAAPSSPPKRRPLKRTASTASLPPTPPRTYSRYSRGRSRGSCDSSDESDAVLGSGGEEDELKTTRHKKQRTAKVVGGDGDEEAFWLGGALEAEAEDTVPELGGGSSMEERTRGRDLTRGSSGSIPAHEDKSDIPLLYRKRRAQLAAAKARVQAQQASASSSTTLDSAPVSPPPSHRKPMPAPAPMPVAVPAPAPTVAPAPTTPPCSTVLDPSKLITPSPPVTPKTQTRLRQRALLDSPDNPFLDTPEAVEGEEQVEDSATPSPETANEASPKTPAPFQEKPTITYVLCVFPFVGGFYFFCSWGFLAVAFEGCMITHFSTMRVEDRSRRLLPRNYQLTIRIIHLRFI